jgi:cytochrome c551
MMLRNVVLAFLLFAMGCSPAKEDKEKNLESISDTKVLQYAIQGKNIYEQYCANCHQKNGEGLGRLIPPLNQSDYMLKDVGNTVKIIKYGIKGEITVNGINYNQPMPGNPQFTDLEIAQLVTYLYNIWGANEGVIDANQVRRYLDN